ncbi:hypothetical protein DFP72DRAFT_423329 [Ephemerocybe angulata]|uniref:Uncharacterized protein n=1 Tax=Ephemerocybe angulata TaxID=980116 RepID=A0A8H6IHL5_9AGAR|nr:hypothetical protein DFP72DRAFT_423329 [Tulosesus angulatus]
MLFLTLSRWDMRRERARQHRAPTAYRRRRLVDPRRGNLRWQTGRMHLGLELCKQKERRVLAAVHQRRNDNSMGAPHSLLFCHPSRTARSPPSQRQTLSQPPDGKEEGRFGRLGCSTRLPSQRNPRARIPSTMLVYVAKGNEFSTINAVNKVARRRTHRRRLWTAFSERRPSLTRSHPH